jgi:hypothetical protein
VIQCDGAAAEEDEAEGQGSQGQGEFVAAIAHQAIMKVHLRDRYGHIDADGEGGNASEQSEKNEDASEEFCERRQIAGPGWESEAVDELSMVLQSSENLVVSVAEHDGTEGQAHDEERERLQAVEVAHGILQRKTIAYISGRPEGRRCDPA